MSEQQCHMRSIQPDDYPELEQLLGAKLHQDCLDDLGERHVVDVLIGAALQKAALGKGRTLINELTQILAEIPPEGLMEAVNMLGVSYWPADISVYDGLQKVLGALETVDQSQKGEEL